MRTGKRIGFALSGWQVHITYKFFKINHTNSGIHLNQPAMKKFLQLLVFLFWFLITTAQSHYLRAKRYDEVYSEANKTPVWIYYELNKKMLTGKTAIDRNKYTFRANPSLPGTNFGVDYLNSGYDRGHLMPAANNSYDAQGMKECFYYTAIVPQTPTLNHGPWKTLETYERNLARKNKNLIVLTGTLGSMGTIGKDQVVIPEWCWKIIIAKDIITNIADTLAYLFENNNWYENASIEHYKLSYKDLERGLFFSIKDMVRLHEIQDAAEQTAYMISAMEERLKNLFAEKLTRESVLQRYQNNYTDTKKFEDDFSKKNISVPKDYTIESFVGTAYDEAQLTINSGIMDFVNDLKSKSSDANFILEKFSNASAFGAVISNIGICSCCGLPLTFPVCGCRLL
jgi:DNA/RNA endonuclease G (NUC1)